MVQLWVGSQKPSLEQPAAQKGAPSDATQPRWEAPQSLLAAQGTQAKGAGSVTPPLPKDGVAEDAGADAASAGGGATGAPSGVT